MRLFGGPVIAGVAHLVVGIRCPETLIMVVVVIISILSGVRRSLSVPSHNSAPLSYYLISYEDAIDVLSEVRYQCEKYAAKCVFLIGTVERSNSENIC